MLQAIRYEKGQLEIIDQLQLPFVEKYIPIRSAEDGWHAIKDMKVRGAPAIAIVAMLSLASELHALAVKGEASQAPNEACEYIVKRLAYLVTSRPTAVNLSDAAGKLKALVTSHASQSGATGQDVTAAFIQAAENMQAMDLEDNQRIGDNGAEWIVAQTKKSGSDPTSVAVLTHCNTGYEPLQFQASHHG